MMVETQSRGRLLPIGLLILGVVLSAVTLVLPGRENLEQRIAFLMFPWGAVGLGLGTLWLTRRPHLEDVVGKVLIGAAIVLAVATAIGVSLS